MIESAKPENPRQFSSAGTRRYPQVPAGTNGDDGDDSANLKIHLSAGTRRYPQVPAGTHGDDGDDSANLAFHLSAGTRRYPQVPAGTHGDALYKLTANPETKGNPIEEK